MRIVYTIGLYLANSRFLKKQHSFFLEKVLPVSRGKYKLSEASGARRARGRRISSPYPKTAPPAI